MSINDMRLESSCVEKKSLVAQASPPVANTNAKTKAVFGVVAGPESDMHVGLRDEPDYAAINAFVLGKLHGLEAHATAPVK